MIAVTTGSCDTIAKHFASVSEWRKILLTFKTDRPLPTGYLVLRCIKEGLLPADTRPCFTKRCSNYERICFLQAYFEAVKDKRIRAEMVALTLKRSPLLYVAEHLEIIALLDEESLRIFAENVLFEEESQLAHLIQPISNRFNYHWTAPSLQAVLSLTDWSAVSALLSSESGDLRKIGRLVGLRYFLSRATTDFTYEDDDPDGLHFEGIEKKEVKSGRFLYEKEIENLKTFLNVCDRYDVPQLSSSTNRKILRALLKGDAVPEEAEVVAEDEDANEASEEALSASDLSCEGL